MAAAVLMHPLECGHLVLQTANLRLAPVALSVKLRWERPPNAPNLKVER